MEWTSFLSSLMHYIDQEGHSYISYNNREYSALRKQLHALKKAYRDGTLDSDKQSILTQLGVDWNAYGANWDKWEAHYFQLVDFKKENGHPNISQLVPGLGAWLSSQRVMKRYGLLSPEKEQLLRDLGVDWNPSQRLNDRWMEKFEQVKAFSKIHGHCNVPRRTMPDPGVWVSAQRAAKKKGFLSQERIDLLNSIGFNWDASELKKTKKTT